MYIVKTKLVLLCILYTVKVNVNIEYNRGYAVIVLIFLHGERFMKRNYLTVGPAESKRIEYKEATLRFGRRRILNFEVF